jgi:hypothetical protein
MMMRYIQPRPNLDPLIEDPTARFDQINQSIGGMDDKGKGVHYTSVNSLLIRLRFQISDENMPDLANLADKYFIESLQKDIRVPSASFCWLIRITRILLSRAKLSQNNRCGRLLLVSSYLSWKNIAVPMSSSKRRLDQSSAMPSGEWNICWTLAFLYRL